MNTRRHEDRSELTVTKFLSRKFNGSPSCLSTTVHYLRRIAFAVSPPPVKLVFKLYRRRVGEPVTRWMTELKFEQLVPLRRARSWPGKLGKSSKREEKIRRVLRNDFHTLADERREDCDRAARTGLSSFRTRLPWRV